MNRDFVEMLSALSEAGAEYLVVGAHAMAAHGVPRATGDLDMVFQIGVPPARIDILTSISAVPFDEAWSERLTVQMGALPVPVLGRAQFLRNKRAVGRPKDLADIALMEELQA